MHRIPSLLAVTVISVAFAAATPVALAAPPGSTLPQGVSQSTDVGGVRTSWREVGSGRPLLLMQRFRGSMEDWDPAFVDALAAEGFKVVLFDSAGVGESAGAAAPTLEGQADFAAAFIKARGLGPVDVLGWSMGGMSAQILAVKHPELVRHLILAGTLPPGGDPQVVPSSPSWNAVAGKPAYTRDDLAYLFFTPTAAGRAAAFASLDRTRGHQAATDIKVSQSAMGAQFAAISGWFKNDGGWYARLGEIKAPTLVANGDRDGAFPAIDSVILARQIPGAQLALYPDAGHGFHFQYSERFAADVATFTAR